MDFLNNTKMKAQREKAEQLRIRAAAINMDIDPYFTPSAEIITLTAHHMLRGVASGSSEVLNESLIRGLAATTEVNINSLLKNLEEIITLREKIANTKPPQAKTSIVELTVKIADIKEVQDAVNQLTEGNRLLSLRVDEMLADRELNLKKIAMLEADNARLSALADGATGDAEKDERIQFQAATISDQMTLIDDLRSQLTQTGTRAARATEQLIAANKQVEELKALAESSQKNYSNLSTMYDELDKRLANYVHEYDERIRLKDKSIAEGVIANEKLGEENEKQRAYITELSKQIEGFMREHMEMVTAENKPEYKNELHDLVLMNDLMDNFEDNIAVRLRVTKDGGNQLRYAIGWDPDQECVIPQLDAGEGFRFSEEEGYVIFNIADSTS